MAIDPTVRTLIAASAAIASLACLGTAQASYQTYRQSCPGAVGTPQLSAGAPFAGVVWNLNVTGLAPNGSGTLFFALRDDSLGTFSLPLDLAFLGAPLCFLNVNSDPGAGAFSLSTGSDPAGQAVVTFVFPNLPGVIGFTFFNQYVSLEAPPGRVLPITTTNAGRGVVGAALGVPNMVAIPPGTFLMGSNATTSAPYYSVGWERPVHQVTISRPFCMSKYEVTQAEYQAVMGSNPSYFQGASYPNSANRPVETLSWNDAMAYCAALTARERAAGRLPAGYQYRLPTEAEWEYCCRAGTTTEFHYGNSLVCGQASFWYSYHTNSSCNNSYGTAVVGGYAANAWGLHDMHGNVWEWCLDAWDGSSNYPAGAVTDPYVSSGFSRVRRGGGWNSLSRGCRSAYRNGLCPTCGDLNLGFRVVLAPVLVP